jgi:hypothetical protein
MLAQRLLALLLDHQRGFVHVQTTCWWCLGKHLQDVGLVQNLALDRLMILLQTRI